MANYVTLKNEKTGQVKNIKIGWNWRMFLFSGFWGLPEFRAKLYVWGGILLAYQLIVTFIVICAAAAGADQDSMNGISFLVGLVQLGLNIFLAICGNEMSVRRHPERGWGFAEPNSKPALFLQLKWAMA